MLSVVGADSDDRPTLACHGQSAEVKRVFTKYLFRIPTQQEKLDLEYLDNDIPILWYGEY